MLTTQKQIINMQKLTLTTEVQYNDFPWVHVTYRASNPWVNNIFHGIDFDLSATTLEEAVNRYMPVATESLFKAVEEIYPNMFTF